MNTFDRGDVVRVRATFTNSAGVGVDPSSIVMRHQVTLPVPTPVTSLVYGVHSITRVTTGQYFTDLAVNSHGEWHYRWEGKGDNAGAADGKFKVLMPIVGD